uniref:Uncharacterized protein n=1 Tax=Oryza glaberrima TaxID=4538 RepID=I1PGK0_ORYGL
MASARRSRGVAAVGIAVFVAVVVVAAGAGGAAAVSCGDAVSDILSGSGGDDDAATWREFVAIGA